MNTAGSATTIDLIPQDLDIAKPATGSDHSFSLATPVTLSRSVPLQIYTPAANELAQLRRAVIATGIPLLTADEIRAELRPDREDQD